MFDSSKYAAVDIETTVADQRIGAKPWADKIVCFAVAGDKDQHWEWWTGPERLKELLAGRTPVFHNANFDVTFLLHNGMDFPNKFQDSYIMAKILMPGFREYGLEFLSKELLKRHRTDKSFLRLYGFDYEKMPVEELRQYNTTDAIDTFALFKELSEKESTPQQQAILDLDHSALRVAIAMQRNGHLINAIEAESVYAALHAREKETLLRIHERVSPTAIEKPVRKWLAAGILYSHKKDIPKELLKEAELAESIETISTPFNPLSPIQTRAAIESAVPSWRLPDLTAKSLMPLKASGLFPAIDYILEYRQIIKLKNTYVRNIIAGLDHNNRLHCEYTVADTETGRFSCRAPNLQNIPKGKDKPEYRAIKRLFIPQSANKLVYVDMSQEELRVCAFMSGDADFIRDVALGRFFENLGAAVGLARDTVKTTIYALLYGAQEAKLAQVTGFSIADVSRIVVTFWQKYPQMAAFTRQIQGALRETGAIKTFYGRERIAAAPHKALSTLVQGTCADVMKIALIRLAQNPTILSYLRLTIHDEVVFEIPKELDTMYFVRNFVAPCMCDFPFNPPLLVSVAESTTSWADKITIAEEVGLCKVL